MSNERFKLWITYDMDEYTDEWAVIDTLTGETLVEDEVVDLLNKYDEEQKQILFDYLKWETEEFSQQFNHEECIRWVNRYLETRK